MLILAGDIGGTTTRLAYFDTADGKLVPVAEERFPSRGAGSLAEIVGRFAEERGLTAERACFGIAGPVRNGKVRTPNLPWSVDAGELARMLGLGGVRLINDLEANAYGIDLLLPEDFAILNPGVPDPTGTIEMHVLRIGDVAIATDPFELFVDYAMQIHGRSPAGQTVLIQLASPVGTNGYLPSERAVKGGGYSAVPQSSQIGPEGGQMLVEHTLAAIRRLFGK